MPECIVMHPALRKFGIVVQFKGSCIFNSIKGSVHKPVPQHVGTTLRHPSTFCLEVARLIDRWVESSVSKQFMWIAEAMDVADFAQNHSAVNGADAGNSHNNGLKALHDFADSVVNFSDLSIVVLNAGNALSYRYAQRLRTGANRMGSEGCEA